VQIRSAIGGRGFHRKTIRPLDYSGCSEVHQQAPRQAVLGAIGGAEGGEAEILPVAVATVVESDARISRNPRSKRSKSSTGSAIVRSLQDLCAILKESNYGWICTGCGGLNLIALRQVRGAGPRLEVPVAAIGAVPTGDVTIRIVGHNAAVGFISRDALGRDRRPQSQFDFVAAIARRRLIDLHCCRDCLCGPPCAGENRRRVTKPARLVDAIRKAGSGLYVTPQTSAFPEMSSCPDTCSSAASSDPFFTLADGILGKWERCFVEVGTYRPLRVNNGRRVPRGRTVGVASSVSASAEQNCNADHGYRLLATGEESSCDQFHFRILLWGFLFDILDLRRSGLYRRSYRKNIGQTIPQQMPRGSHETLQRLDKNPRGTPKVSHGLKAQTVGLLPSVTKCPVG
jgi:hypothetical protein